MKTEDEILVDGFLKASVKEIPDSGFSRRVMHRIPNRASRFNRWWQLFCTAVFLALFTLQNGFSIVWQLLTHCIETAPHSLALSTNSMTGIAALVVVGCWHLCQEWKLLD